MTAPVLDRAVLDGLRARIGSDKVTRLIALFGENVRAREIAARRALADGDERALAVALHSIKGSAQLIGARRLEELAARWEQAVRAGDTAAVAEAIGEIHEAYARVESALAGDAG